MASSLQRLAAPPVPGHATQGRARQGRRWRAAMQSVHSCKLCPAAHLTRMDSSGSSAGAARAVEMR